MCQQMVFRILKLNPHKYFTAKELAAKTHSCINSASTAVKRLSHYGMIKKKIGFDPVSRRPISMYRY